MQIILILKIDLFDSCLLDWVGMLFSIKVKWKNFEFL